jgi:uncharacterized protein (TIRG00374 family)
VPVKKEIRENFDEEQREVLESIRFSRIIFPVLLGVGVVAYLFWRQYDPDDFAQINWTSHTAFWVGISFLFLVIRHIAYATRLRILSDKAFSWKKCIELIFIWEFSSAVSPTSLGGSAVALFVLAQEKLPTAKTTTIVLYSAILDTIFFLTTLPTLFLIFGPEIIRPGMQGFNDIDGWGYTFLGAYVLMFTYGTLFFYGMFVNPVPMKKLIVGFTMLGFLRKYRHQAIELGNDIIIASKEMKFRSWKFHLGGFLSTATAWSCRFFLLNCLVIAFVDTTPLDFETQIRLYARLETMFVIMAFSPTPGAAGFAELLFFGFIKDYVPFQGIALIIASIWRLFTYYAYLFIGTIIIPNWIRTVLNERKKRRLEKEEEAKKEL